jgi:hypothetical protein
MKTNILAILCLTFLPGFASRSLAADATVAVNSDLQRLGAPPAVYYLHQKETKTAIVENAAKLFDKLNQHTNAGLDIGLLGNAGKGGRLRVDMPDRHFYALGDESLGFVYSKNLDRFLQPSDPQFGVAEKRLPDAARSVELAGDYLARLGLQPSDPSEMRVTKVKVIRASTCGQAECKPEVSDKMRVVFFGRKLNGLPVHGASRMVVRIGNDGELVSVIKNWPSVTPVAVESAGVLPKAQWKDAAVRTVKRLQAGTAYPNATIESTEVVMYDDGRGCIEPALRVKGKKLDGRGKDAPAAWMVPLMTAPKARYAESAVGTPGAGLEADSVGAQE